MKEKAELRQQVKKLLEDISFEDYERKSKLIAEKLFQSDWWEKCNVIGLTISRGKEVLTAPIIRKAWDSGKEVVVPRCNPEDYTMNFRKITSFSQLENAYFGLQEPIVSETELYAAHNIDIIVVPGVVFSPSGYRIGYGGGYYDRYLSQFNGKKVALAFSFQVREQVPYEEHDIPVETIVTDVGIINCHG